MTTHIDQIDRLSKILKNNIKLSTANNKDENLRKWPKRKLSRIPPIFLHDQVIEKHANKIQKLNIKCRAVIHSDHPTKITCSTTDDHKAMVKYLEQNSLHYHTYGHPSKRKLKVVIKGLPIEIDIVKVKGELKKLSIPIIRVHKMHTKDKEKTTKLLILAVVPYDDKGKLILGVQKLLGYDIKMEPLHFRVMQCYRCQKWGHAQRYCHGVIKCVKCAGDHSYKKCDKIKTEEPPKCANCGGEHTANYKQCPCSPYSDAYKLGRLIKQ